jgi:argininosuccinate synthase
VPATIESPYSTDSNLWGRSIECGVLEDPWTEPPEEIYTLTRNPNDCPAQPAYVEIEFEGGTPVKINGIAMPIVDLIASLETIAGAHGVGRIDMVENRLVGIKSRGVYETPAGTVLHLAHREIERLVLDRDTLHFKQSVSVRYAPLIYDGLWFSTLRQALAAFVDFTEQEVTGEVRVRLFKGRAEAIGRRSPRSLYRQDLATFGAGMDYDHKHAEGFIRLYGLPERVRALTREKLTQQVEG